MINVTLTSAQVRLIGFALNAMKRYETDIQAISPASDEHDDRLYELAEIQNLLLSAACLSEVVLPSWPMKIEQKADGTVYPFPRKNVLQAALGKNITSNQLRDAGYVYQGAGIWERENKSSPVHPSILQESTSWPDYLKREPKGLLTVGSRDIYMSEAHMKECGYVRDGQDSRRWRRKTVVPYVQADWTECVYLRAHGMLFKYPFSMLQQAQALAVDVKPTDLMLAGYTPAGLGSDIYRRTHKPLITYDWNKDLSTAIEMLPLSDTVKCLLAGAGIRTVGDLIVKSDKSLLELWFKSQDYTSETIQFVRAIRDFVLAARAK